MPFWVVCDREPPLPDDDPDDPLDLLPRTIDATAPLMALWPLPPLIAASTKLAPPPSIAPVAARRAAPMPADPPPDDDAPAVVPPLATGALPPAPPAPAPPAPAIAAPPARDAPVVTAAPVAAANVFATPESSAEPACAPVAITLEMMTGEMTVETRSQTAMMSSAKNASLSINKFPATEKKPALPKNCTNPYVPQALKAKPKGQLTRPTVVIR